MTYRMREDSGAVETCQATTLVDAKQEVHGWAGNSDYGDVESTIWIDTRIEELVAGEDGERWEHVETVTTQLDPAEPDCGGDDGHDWQSPHEIVGGDKSNPGVYGHGGGVRIHEACMRCGCERVTDTWAQRPDTGEQGLRSVSYEPGKYADAVRLSQAEGR